MTSKELLKALITPEMKPETIQKIAEIDKAIDEEVSSKDKEIEKLKKDNGDIQSAYIDLVKNTGFKSKESDSTDAKTPPKETTFEDLFKAEITKKEK